MAKLKINQKMIDKAYKYAQLGNKDKAIYTALGISETSYYDYLKKAETLSGKGSLSDYNKLILEFSESIKKGRAEAEIRNLGLIQKAAKTTWQAAAWHLERSNPEDWGNKMKIDQKVSGDKDNPLNVNVNHGIQEELLKDEKSRELLKQLFRRSKELD